MCAANGVSEVIYSLISTQVASCLRSAATTEVSLQRHWKTVKTWFSMIMHTWGSIQSSGANMQGSCACIPRQLLTLSAQEHRMFVKHNSKSNFFLSIIKHTMHAVGGGHQEESALDKLWSTQAKPSWNITSLELTIIHVPSHSMHLYVFKFLYIFIFCLQNFIMKWDRSQSQRARNRAQSFEESTYLMSVHEMFRWATCEFQYF